jgi:hypothetical protein
MLGFYTVIYAMKVVVILMRRDGVAIRKGALPYESELKGYLTVCDTQQNYLHRLVKTAKLSHDQEGERVIATLLEPTLIWANQERFTLSGFERGGSKGVEIDYAQSWLCLIGWEQTLKDKSKLEDNGPISRRRHN